jgi:hypothetical protein
VIIFTYLGKTPSITYTAKNQLNYPRHQQKRTIPVSLNQIILTDIQAHAIKTNHHTWIAGYFFFELFASYRLAVVD